MFWLAAAKNAGAQDVRLLAWIGVFISLICVLSWVLEGVSWFRHLGPLLRQAEAN